MGWGLRCRVRLRRPVAVPQYALGPSDTERSVPGGNPAERLHRIMERLARGPDQLTMAEVLTELSTYVTADQDSEEQSEFTRAQLMQMFGALMALPSEIRRAIDRLPREDEDLDHLRAPLGDVEQMMQKYGLKGNWKQYSTSIDGQTISELRGTAQALRRHGWVDNDVTQEDLARLHREVADLFDKVNSSDLNDDLCRFVLRYLDRIERGIRHYQVEGTPLLEEAIDEFYGELLRDHAEEHRRGLRKFIEEENLGRELVRLIGEVNGVVQLVQVAIGAGSSLPLPPFGG